VILTLCCKRVCRLQIKFLSVNLSNITLTPLSKSFLGQRDDMPTIIDQVPKWNRGKEWVQLIQPRIQMMPMLGLGMSVGTNGSLLEADVVVVSSFDELREKGENNVRLLKCFYIYFICSLYL
jgi:hypothetical protein